MFHNSVVPEFLGVTTKFPLRVLFVIASCGLGSVAMAAALPTPAFVPGKEYSDNVDLDQLQFNDPLQNLYWDGLGANSDAFDYSNSGPPPADPDQVDALANAQDHLFTQLLGNQVSMIVSLDQENFLRNHNPNGTAGTWATANQIRSPNNPAEVDAVELYGGPTAPQSDGSGGSGVDANHYSYIGDAVVPGPPAIPGTPPISIFYYNGVSSTPYILHQQILNQLNGDFNFGLSSVDVDALMVLDNTQIGLWETTDTIIFSLRPTGTLDGGELFVWQNGLPMQYLVQGGVTWDTVNSVAGIFAGASTENIDALEAVVPEPATIGMLLLGGLACCGYRNLRNKSLRPARIGPFF